MFKDEGSTMGVLCSTPLLFDNFSLFFSFVEELLEDIHPENGNEEYGGDMLLLRKLTHRHHFKASVKYLPGNPHSDSVVNTTDGITSINLDFITSQQQSKPDHQHQMGHNLFAPEYSLPPERYQYFLLIFLLFSRPPFSLSSVLEQSLLLTCH